MANRHNDYVRPRCVPCTVDYWMRCKWSAADNWICAKILECTAQPRNRTKRHQTWNHLGNWAGFASLCYAPCIHSCRWKMCIGRRALPGEVVCPSQLNPNRLHWRNAHKCLRWECNAHFSADSGLRRPTKRWHCDPWPLERHLLLNPCEINISYIIIDICWGDWSCVIGIPKMMTPRNTRSQIQYVQTGDPC